MAEYIAARQSNGRKGSFILVAHGQAAFLEGAVAFKSFNQVAAQQSSPVCKRGTVTVHCRLQWMLRRQA
jgi:hypothetical protein